MVSASTLQLLGAGGLGFVVGWYVYYINRYRRSAIQMSDLLTLIGAIGGGATTALFPAKTDLFGAYGVGLFCGFLSYLLLLVILVGVSKNFDVDWFLDGRRIKPSGNYEIPGGWDGGSRAMSEPESGRQARG